VLVKTETAHDLSPRALAETLANAEPSDFAEFWFAFHGACSKEKLDKFAQAMCPQIGSCRKWPLQELAKLVEFHSVKNEREKA
jgi:hypothetical protein